MRILILTALAVSSVAGVAGAQVFTGGDPYAQTQQDRMERLRQQSDRIADYSAQYRNNTRLNVLELQAQRQPEIERISASPIPWSGVVPAARPTPRSAPAPMSPDGIDRWLDRRPRD